MLELRNITKTFGSVVANDDVSLVVQPGTVHAIVGENGAGKSTAMRVAYGFYAADAGDIVLDGAVRRIRRPADAIALGVGMVHQHFMLVGPLTVTENATDQVLTLPLHPFMDEGTLDRITSAVRSFFVS